MKNWLINLLYLSIYAILLPRILWRRIVAGRPIGNWPQRVLGLVDERRSGRKCVWIHAVSVGEVNQIATILQPLQQQLEDWDFVLSVTTSTGMKLACDKYPDLQKFYLPIDFTWSIARAMRRIRPSLLVLTELELWPNLIDAATNRETPIAVINGRISDSSFRGYRQFSWVVRSMFRKLSLVAAQTDTYRQRFCELGTPQHRVHVVGSIKFDGALITDNEPLKSHLRNICHIQGDEAVLVAGSTQHPEEQFAAQVWLDVRRDHPGLKLVVVPRHPHRANQVVKGLKEMGVSARLRSSLRDSDRLAPNEILIVDVIGELAHWWELSDIGFVGGSFGDRGGQNMIEPAAAGTAVCFGPNTWNFKQVVELMIEHDAARVVENIDELRQFVQQCLRDKAWASQLGDRAYTLVMANQGGAKLTAELLAALATGQRLSPRFPAKDESRFPAAA